MSNTKGVKNKNISKVVSKNQANGGFIASTTRKATLAAFIFIGLALISKGLVSYLNPNKLSATENNPQVINLNSQPNSKNQPSIIETTVSATAPTPQTGSEDFLPIITSALFISVFGVYLSSKSRKAALKNFERSFLKD